MRRSRPPATARCSRARPGRWAPADAPGFSPHLRHGRKFARDVRRVVWCHAERMDGVHDMGGMQGFGPVEVETDEPAFHEAWERRAMRLSMAAMMSGRLSGRFRHAIERMDPGWYLTSPYYEHWFSGAATCLVVARGVIPQTEREDRLGAPFPLARPIRAPRLDDPGPSSDAHRFAVGQGVRVREWHPLGHTRAPRYVQGKRGRVVRRDPAFSL